MKTHFKEGDINKELTDKWFKFREIIVVLIRRLILQFLGWVFLGLLTYRVTKKASLPRICHTYRTMMHSYTLPRRFESYLNHVTHPLISADITIFHRKSASFAKSRNTNIDWILIRNF